MTGALRRSARAIVRAPLTWAIALVIIAGEAGCHARARSYPTDRTAELRIVDRELRDHADRPLGIDLDRNALVFRNASVLVLDGLVLLQGTRAASAREAWAGVVGTWLGAVPLGLVALLLYAALLPTYVRRQLVALGERAAASATHGRNPFGHVLLARLIVSAGCGAAAVAGALPGLGIVLVVADGESDVAALVALLVTILGALVAYLWVRLGWLFADRHVVLARTGAIAALRATWRAADGMRLSHLAWLVIATLIELAGALGWLLFVLGVLTHGWARATADTWLTLLYRERVAPRTR